MKYTIIITVYNKEKYIEKSILSVMNQTAKNFELLVVDDGSTDKSELIIKKLQEKYNFKYIKKKNTGVSDTRNYAIKKVKTPYFLFLDADDYLDKNLLERVQYYNDYDLISFNGINLNEKGSFIKKMDKPIHDGNGEEFYKKLVKENSIFTVPWGYIYNTNFFKKNKYEYPKGKILEDYFLTQFIIIDAKKVKSINYCGYYYIDNNNSIMKSDKDYIGKIYLDHYREMLKKISKYNINIAKIFKGYLASTLIWYATTLEGKIKNDYIKIIKKEKIPFNLYKKKYKKPIIILLYYINLYYPIRNLIMKIINNNKIDEEYYLYGNEEICKSLAYVLDLYNYKIIKEIKKYDKKIIIIDNNKSVKKEIKKQNLIYKKDYILIKDIYKMINKEYINTLVWKKHRFYINKNNLINIYNLIRPASTNLNKINKMNQYYLKNSELFIKTINDKAKDINCDNIQNTCNIDSDGNIWGCCPGWIKNSFGNILKEKDPYNSYLANILKLSSLKKTYTFCDFKRCIYYKPNTLSENVNFSCKNKKNYPKSITISIDRACNLKCKSCRKSFYTKTDNKTKILSKKIIETGWLDCSDIVLAGQGEVFLSPIYKDLLFNKINREYIEILSNGILLTEKNMKLLKEKYKRIKISISIDAAYENTYKELRNGNFKLLQKNLEMIGNERIKGAVIDYQLNFCVQKDNYKEMKDFIRLGKKLNVDRIQFTKLSNWGTFSNNEYIEKSLIEENDILNYELYKEFKDKIFEDKIVDLTSFKKLINNSDIYYNKNK